ncbi:MAG TPA: methyltransferase domain-containing protein [Chloroflexota bacterium]|nr:methyltransferase domain-containing protein [Chloroflexota bacterium]
MKRSLLTWLVCPDCKTDLRCTPTEERDNHIVEGTLTCTQCAATFAIRHGVPRMVRADLPPEQERTAEAFAYEWQHFDAVHDTYERQFLEWIDPLRPEDFKGKAVLEGGCGMGRHTLLAAEYGADPIIAVDLSEAVNVAQRHTAALPNAHVVQADIYRLPFRAPFDLAYSVGVLHHLPDPDQGFLSLLKHVRPSGRVAAWVYGAEGNFLVAKVFNPLRLAVTSRLPLSAVNAASWAMAAAAYPVVKGVFGAIQRRPALKQRLSPIPYVEYFSYLSDFSLNQIHSIVFDHLSPPIAYYLTRQDMERWASRADLQNVKIGWHKRYSWRLTGTKPGAPVQNERDLVTAGQTQG